MLSLTVCSVRAAGRITSASMPNVTPNPDDAKRSSLFTDFSQTAVDYAIRMDDCGIH
jgi:hypothetical protein